MTGASLRETMSPDNQNEPKAANTNSVGSVEKPSGKGAKDENFPVGSFLLPKRLRPHVATYYAFARAIDDIADDEDLPPADKIQRLQAMNSALKGEPGYNSNYAKAHALRMSMIETNVPTVHGSHLVEAFVQDCKKRRYQTWDELLGYCARSANPVGRYLLDLHGEDPSGYKYSDALCTVLQITNHLQDCGDDRRSLDRVYVIQPWLEEAGGHIEDLDASKTSPALRATMDRMLDGCDALMLDARKLPSALKSRHLAMESAVIVRLAYRLIQILRKGDPLESRVALTKFDFARAGLFGMVDGFFSANTKSLPESIPPTKTSSEHLQ
ncbi:MAG: squalene synthase HpnC [Pseudomonadota bacterium]